MIKCKECGIDVIGFKNKKGQDICFGCKLENIKHIKG